MAESAKLDNATAIGDMVAALCAYFNRHRDMRCLLAVDPSQSGLFDDEDDEHPFSKLPRTIVEIDHEAFPEAHRPYFLPLDLATPQGVALLAESVRLAFEDRHPESMAEGQGQRIGGWLATSASLNEVAAHWSRHALQYNEQGRPCVLRFYDARALGLIWPILSGGQQQALLGPVTTWHALDACAKPIAYTAVAQSRTDLSLTTEQWQEIHRHGLINRALALHALSIRRQPKPVEVETAIAAAARADGYGLLDRDDQIAFIGHALAWHPQFDLHPKVLQILSRKDPDDFYTAAISDLTSTEITEIQQGDWYDRLVASASR
ncbi:DUF4123 domain-containing protein [Paraburkholderia sp. Cy-641]|nr:DUF4123 domain-containing protein [Paraburkholderia sp. Cy-641]NIF81680.1 DUF4123 domain-containing protein [Paraburkholderia sp. Cy-641]